jgi:hypothetical protein
MKQNKPKMLYRKVNTKARGVHHRFGGDYRDERNSKNADVPTSKMKRGEQRGLDYTPLFQFLISNVGKPWDEVHSEAVSRLDKQEPIFWLVSLEKDNAQSVVRAGESTYFSGLYVDSDGILQFVSPEIGPKDLEPLCGCCTHTLNGKKFTRKFKERNGQRLR